MPRQGLRRVARPIFPSEDGASGSTSRDGSRLLPSMTRRHSERGPESEESEDDFGAEDIGELEGEDEFPEDIEEHGHDEEEEDEEEEEEVEDDEDLRYASAPLPPNLREISSLASWTVSTYKPGSGVTALRHPSPSQFWQSDGPQPHTLTLHFFKRVSIVRIRVYLDFGLDESYTPTKMIFLAGMGGNDLVEFATWQGESPCGWVDVGLDGVGGGHGHGYSLNEGQGWKPNRHRQRRIPRRYMRMSQDGHAVEASLEDIESSNNEVFVVYEGEDPDVETYQRRYIQGLDHFSDLDQREANDYYSPYEDEDDYENDEDDPLAGNVLKAMVLQVKVCENHQNGKDTHVRGFQVYARDDRYFARGRRNSARKSLRGSGVGAKVGGVPEMHDLANDLSQLESEQDTEFMPRFKESDWLMEPELR